MSIVKQIVSRCHVSESNRSVINYVVSALRDGRRTFLGLSKETRRDLMLAAISAHAQNRQLYADVMSGNF